MNPIQTALAEDDELRKLFNQLVERCAIESNRGFDVVYRELEQALNSFAQYVIEEEP